MLRQWTLIKELNGWMLRERRSRKNALAVLQLVVLEENTDGISEHGSEHGSSKCSLKMQKVPSDTLDAGRASSHRLKA